MSLAELTVYAQRNRLRVGIVTNARRRETRLNGRMLSVYAATETRLVGVVAIDEPGGFAELELAAAELVAELRAQEPSP